MLLLTPEQQLLLKTIYAHFHERSQWPTYYVIGRQLVREINVEKVAKSMPHWLIGSDNAWQASPDNQIMDPGQAMISIRAIHACPGSGEDTAAFIKAIRFCTEVFFDPAREPEVGSADFITLFDYDSNMAARVFQMMNYEVDLLGGGTTSDIFSLWYRRVSQGIQAYKGVESVEQYLAIREQKRGESVILSEDELAILRYIGTLLTWVRARRTGRGRGRAGDAQAGPAARAAGAAATSCASSAGA